MHSRLLLLIAMVFSLCAGRPCLSAAEGDEDSGLRIYPPQFVMTGDNAQQQLVVTGRSGAGELDLTRRVHFRAADPQVAVVSAEGVVRPVGDGQTRIVAEWEGRVAEAACRIRDSGRPLPVSFDLDVMPILTARGCNAGACHGKARGQNGFQLSLLGFDPEFDYAALTKNGRGRRVFPAAPQNSLLLQKAAALVPHGGGRRIAPGGDDYRTLRRWIENGLARRIPDSPALERLELWPPARSMRPEQEQQLVVTAHYSDGSQRDVTALANFQSSEPAVVPVSQDGLITTGPLPGEASIMVRYMGHIATCRVTIPLDGEVAAEQYAKLPRANFIDELVWKKLAALGIVPSPPADDAKFLRRATLDILGRLPTPEEVRTFLADSDPGRRAKLVDRLLEQPGYADHWATKWNDLLLPNPYRIGIKNVLNYDRWIREQFRHNVPYDQFVRQLVTAQGSSWQNGAVNLFRDRRTPDEVTTLVSQLFLGIRLECAKCHQHPFEKWGQEHFYGFAAFFARVGHAGGGLSPPISGAEEKIFTADADGKRYVVRHPLTDEVLQPQFLFGETPELDPEQDPRLALADWMTSDENDFFAQVMANRVWTDLMGRGIVDPVDDFRATNPPSNEALLQALGDHFRRVDFDLKQLIRTICLSEAYRLSSATHSRNVADTRNFSRHYRQRLRAEVLLDAICDVTGVPEDFEAMPPGARATQLWTRRVGSVFLDTFGRPDRNQDPPCEQNGETAVTQALHLMNSPALHAKVTSDRGRAAELAASELPPAKIVEELYLRIYNRYPDQAEASLATQLFAKPGTSRRQATEDLMWAMLNTPEFIFKD